MTRRWTPRWAIGTAAALLLCAGLAGDARPRAAEASVDVGALIDEASAAYGVNATTMRRIAFCESRWFPGAYNRSSGASGLFQFVPSTWRWASWQAGFGGASPFDPVANAYAAGWLMANGGPRHWVCR